MINAIIVAVVVITAVWVYIDATKNKIGKIHGIKSVFNMSAGAWGVVTLLLWIIGFPAYLIKRSDLIDKAKENPVEAKGRAAKAIALSIVGVCVLVLIVYSANFSSSLPACNDADAQSLVGSIVNDMSIVKAAGAQFVSLKNISELGFNQDTQTRSCSATLVTSIGENDLQYSIKWSNADKTKYYIEARIVQ
ncbi:MAG: hypothetical protein ACRETA_01095 [Gammaproteobacteria bacterium]